MRKSQEDSVSGIWKVFVPVILIGGIGVTAFAERHTVSADPAMLAKLKALPICADVLDTPDPDNPGNVLRSIGIDVSQLTPEQLDALTPQDKEKANMLHFVPDQTRTYRNGVPLGEPSTDSFVNLEQPSHDTMSATATVTLTVGTFTCGITLLPVE